MVILRNNMSRPRVFTLADKSTLRLLSNQEKTLNEKLFTADILDNVTKGTLSVRVIPTVTQPTFVQKKSKKEESKDE